MIIDHAFLEALRAEGFRCTSATINGEETLIFHNATDAARFGPVRKPPKDEPPKDEPPKDEP